MSYDIGPKIGIEGEAEFKKAISSVSGSLTVLGSEMKKVSAQFSDNSGSMEALTARSDVLTKQINDQTLKVNLLRSALDNAKKEFGDNSEQAQQWQIKLNNAEASLAKTESQLKQTTTQMNSFGNETEQATEKSGLLSKIFAGGFLANIASNALSSLGNMLKSFATSALETADQLKGLTAETGLTSTELQKLRYVGEDVGVEMETMATSMKRIVKSMTAARDGTGAQADAYKKLGVSITEANGELRDGNTVYGEVINSLGKMTNETERDSLAQIVLGRSATELNAIIELGADGMKALGDEAETTGAIMSEDAVNALDATGDALDHAKQRAVAFVGEALAGIIDSGKSASETMNDLMEELGAQNNISALIEKYRQLTSEVGDSSLSSEELSNKTSELEEAKQALIKASGGVVTAFDIENGTFDQQVKMLEGATESEKKYLKSKLTARILENSGEEAKRKATEAMNAYTTAEQRLGEAIEERAKTQEKVENNRASIEALQRTTEAVETWESKMASAVNAMAEVNESAAIAESSLNYLVDNGLMTAAEAAEVFANSGIDVNAVLARTSEVAAQTIPAIQSMADGIDALNAEYQEAYDSALASLQGQYDLWSDAPEIVQTSVAKMQSVLDGNVEYFSNYKTNIETLLAVEIPGVDMKPLLDSISDGTPEAAARAQALADAIKAGDTATVAALAKQAADAKSSQEALATALGKAATDYDAKYKAIVDTAEKAVKDMDKTEEAIQSGKNTITGYITGVNSKSSALNLAMSNAAKSAMAAWKKVFDEHSPSREMEKSGENAIKGEIIGVKNMQGELVEVFAETAKRALNGFVGGIGDSVKVVLKAAKDMSSLLLDEETRLQSEIAKVQEETASKTKKTDAQILEASLTTQLKLVQDFKKQYDSAIAEVQKSQDKMSEKLVAFGDLFQRTKDAFGGETLGLLDLQPQIDSINDYGKALEDLKARGVSDTLLEEIQGMSIEDATQYTQKLLGKTDEEYAKYMALWEEKQAAAKEVAKKFYQSEIDALKTEFADKIPKELGSIKDQMKTLGTDAGKALADSIRAGFASAYTGVAASINSQISANPTQNTTASTVAKIGSGIVNGVASIMVGSQSDRPIVVQSILDGRIVAESVYNPLQDITTQKGG